MSANNPNKIEQNELPTKPMAEDEADVGVEAPDLHAFQEPLALPKDGQTGGGPLTKENKKQCPATKDEKCYYVNGVCKACKTAESSAV